MEKRELKIVFLSFVILLLAGIVTNYSDDFGITGKGILTYKSTIDAAVNTPTDAAVLHTREVLFKWRVENGEQKKYEISIADNVAFTSPSNFQGFTQNEKKVIMPEEGTYFYMVRLHDEQGWGKWSEIRQFTVSLDKFTCKDGTEAYTCAETKPYYCDGLGLKEDCNRCGCPNNGFCQEDGSCITVEVTEINCRDGTEAGECSSIKPLYCTTDGRLIQRSGLCGCLEGSEEDDGGNGCVKIEAPKKRGFLTKLREFFNF